MASLNPQMGGFANENFVLLNGDFWHLVENRRYVQAHAWLLEFSRILLEWIRSRGIPNPIWTDRYRDRNTQQWVTTEDRPLEETGPLEIIKFCENNSRYIASANPNIQFELQQRMNEIRKLRNQITHNNIEDSQPLINLLVEMKEVCE
jgi:hypothetical protein